MKLLIVGGGGREHALAWKAAQSKQVSTVYVAPGNAGTALEDKLSNIPIDAQAVPELVRFARDRRVDLTIVGPEAPLVAGIVDAFTAAGLRCFGPSQAAAQLEGSKTFTKDFLTRHHIPTARYRSFTDLDRAKAYIQAMGAPIVIKADGLAAGKGVVLAETLATATAAATEMLSGNAFGDAGKRILIEDYLRGEEVSFICMVDGRTALPLATTQDHKAAYDHDTGPNTGGMGAYSPAAGVTPSMHQRIMRKVINPTVTGLAAMGHPFVGFLYAGLMITHDGTPQVLEFNVRGGDPETQPLMMRLNSDLVTLCDAALAGRLDRMRLEWTPKSAIGVVMAAGGYPGGYPTGDIIHGLAQARATGCKVFHAGTATDAQGAIVTHGGRVLCVTALGDNIMQARDTAYRGVNCIDWRGARYRSDIGHQAIKRTATAVTHQHCAK